MNALSRQRHRAFRVGKLARGKEVHEQRAAGLRQLRNHGGIRGDFGVARPGLRNRDGRKQHELRIRMQPGHLAQMRLELRAELAQSGAAREGLIHAVTEHDDIRWPPGQQRLQVFDITLGAQPVTDFIPGPRQAAHAEAQVGMRQLQLRLEVARLQQALDHPAAVKQKQVVLCQRDGGARRGIGGEGVLCEHQQQGGERQQALHCVAGFGMRFTGSQAATRSRHDLRVAGRSRGQTPSTASRAF